MGKEEHDWEQELEEASLTLRRSKSRNGDIPISTTNGNSESNGHHKLDEADDDNNGIDQEEKIAALPRTQVEIHSKETPVADFDTKSITPVYHDSDEGIWKCRICTWTYGTAYVSTDLVQNPKGHLHELMLYKTLDQRKSCHTPVLEGTKLNSIHSGEEHVEKSHGDGILDISAGNLSVQKNFDSILDNSHVDVDGNKKDSNPLTVQHSEILPEEYDTSSKSLDKNDIENEDVDPVNESDLEVTEVDLERVLEKQNTHDLFCPNCNSCITKRVILRKRKRGVRLTSKDIKRSKPEAAVDYSFTRGHQPETSYQIHSSAEIHSDVTPELVENDTDRERKPDIFRCLSCFSFFIPTGNGFKILRMFENKGQAKAVQDQHKSMSKSWISSIFGSHQEPLPEPGRDIRSDDTPTARSESLLPSSNVNAQSFSEQKDLGDTQESKGPVKSGIAESQKDGDKISHNLIKEQLIYGKEIPSTGDNSRNATEMNKDEHFEAVTGSQTSSSSVPVDAPTDHKDSPGKVSTDRIPVNNGKLPENVVPGSQTSTSKIPKDVPAGHQSGTVEASADKIPVNGKLPENVAPVSPPDGLKLLISSQGSSPTHEKLGAGQNADLTIQNSSRDILHVGAMIVNNSNGGISATVKQINYGEPDLNENSQQTPITNGIYTGELFKIDKDASVLSTTDPQLVPGGQANIIKELVKGTAELTEGKDTIIVVEPETVYRPDSQLSENLNVSEQTGASPSLDTRVSVTDRREADGAESYQIDIIKSIVYGGLIESIVSLGIVSSAAGGGTGTLNIVTLSLANVIGGLVLIFHNLWDLKKEQVSDQLQQKGGGCYAELLGRRENFLLHAVVAMLSFLIFGLIPPIAYGLSFRKRGGGGGRELRILATAVAGLASILVLATGKAYVRKPPKSYLKTITYFILMGFMVSGISYAVGDLLNGFLSEKLHFQSNSQGSLTLQQTTTVPDLASY